MPPAIFHFLLNSIFNMAKDFYSYPLKFDNSFIPVNVGVKQVCIDNHARCVSQFRPTTTSQPFKPCTLCSYKGFEDQHYPLGYKCGVVKLSSNEIIKVMDVMKTCPTCALAHSIKGNYGTLGLTKPAARDVSMTDICCMLLHACTTVRQSSITVSKGGSDRVPRKRAT